MRNVVNDVACHKLVVLNGVFSQSATETKYVVENFVDGESLICSQEQIRPTVVIVWVVHHVEANLARCVPVGVSSDHDWLIDLLGVSLSVFECVLPRPNGKKIIQF